MFAKRRVFRHFLRRAMQLHTAHVEKIAVITAFQRQLHILFDQKDRHASFGQIKDDAENLVHDLRRKAKRRLVQHQKLRFRHKGAPDGQHLLLTAGHAAGHAVSAFLQHRKQVENFGAQGLEALARSTDMGRDEVFLHRQALKDLPPFGAMRQAQTHDLFGTRAGNVTPLEMDGSSRWTGDAGNGIEQRGLARPVRPENDDDLTRINLEIDAFKNADAPVSRAEPGDLEQRP